MSGQLADAFERERRRKAFSSLCKYMSTTNKNLLPKPYKRKGDGAMQWWFKDDCVEAKNGDKKPIIELCIEVLGGIFCTQFFKSKGIDWKAVIRDRKKYISIRNELLQLALTRLASKTRKEGVFHSPANQGEVL